MIAWRSKLYLFVLVLLGCASLGFAAEPVFHRRDGSASFPDAGVPHDFDGVTGKHIRWKTPLPNWSNSSPIVDDGKVFLLSEPVASESYAPILHCFDADSGRELWRRELDPVTCLPEGERAAVRTFAKETWAWWVHQQALWSEAYLLRKEHEKAFTGEQPPPAIATRWEEIRKEVIDAGFTFEFKQGAGGPRAPFKLTKASSEGEQGERLSKLKDMGLGLAAWRGFGTWLGVAYPTPVSHEGRVYVVTQHNHFVCYNHAGELIWQRRFPKPIHGLLTDATRKRVQKRWRPKWPGTGGFSTAPIMVGRSVAFDRRTDAAGPGRQDRRAALGTALRLGDRPVALLSHGGQG